MSGSSHSKLGTLFCAMPYHAKSRTNSPSYGRFLSLCHDSYSSSWNKACGTYSSYASFILALMSLLLGKLLSIPRVRQEIHKGTPCISIDKVPFIHYTMSFLKLLLNTTSLIRAHTRSHRGTIAKPHLPIRLAS
jgi:hypothetical protein